MAVLLGQKFGPPIPKRVRDTFARAFRASHPRPEAVELLLLDRAFNMRSPCITPFRFASISSVLCVFPFERLEQCGDALASLGSSRPPGSGKERRECRQDPKKSETAVTYHQILKRYTGFSCPIFGLQWDASASDTEVARDVVADLADRRVLYAPIRIDETAHYVESVGEIGDRLMDALDELAYQSPLDNQVRKVRQAARRFIDRAGHSGFDTFAPPVQRSVLRRELARLREKFGEAVAELSISHGVEVDDDLASIIPFDHLAG